MSNTTGAYGCIWYVICYGCTTLFQKTKILCWSGCVIEDASFISWGLLCRFRDSIGFRAEATWKDTLWNCGRCNTFKMPHAWSFSSGSSVHFFKLHYGVPCFWWFMQWAIRRYDMSRPFEANSKDIYLIIYIYTHPAPALMNHHSMESPRIGRKLKQGHLPCVKSLFWPAKKTADSRICMMCKLPCGMYMIWINLSYRPLHSSPIHSRLITMKGKVFAEKDLRAGCSKRFIWRLVMSLCSAILLLHWPHQLTDQDKSLGLARNFKSLYALRLFCEVLCDSVFCKSFLNLVSLERFLFLDVMMSEWLTCYIGTESWDGPFTSASQH